MPCSDVVEYQRFGGLCCLHLVVSHLGKSVTLYGKTVLNDEVLGRKQ